MKKRDPYKHKERYLKWLKKNRNGIGEISLENSSLILAYVYDMQEGLNVAVKSKKGPRSYTRLNNIIQRMVFLIRAFEKIYGLEDISKMDEKTLHEYFNGIKNGEIRRLDGEIYKDPANLVKIFKAFWHWWQKVNRKHGNEIRDITVDLDTSKDKPKWVYLSEEQIQRLCQKASFEYKVLITFLYDSGIRAPTELLNVRISDFYNDFQELHIREEISKTFGRRIKLMLSSELIQEYIGQKGLSGEDYLFSFSPFTINNHLQKLAKNVLGTDKSLAGQKYSELTMYDLRHCSCCYWLPKYNSEQGLKYRFGWKKSERIYYYSEMLGMQDTINERDLMNEESGMIYKRKVNKIYTDNRLQESRLDFIERKIQELIKKSNLSSKRETSTPHQKLERPERRKT